MRSGSLLVALLGIVASCNFDAAFKRYCENNPQCVRDSSVGPEIGFQPETSSGPETSPPRDAGDAATSMTLPLPRICGPSLPCAGPRDVCHPSGQVCMTTCNGPADCPPWDTCAPLRALGSGPGTSVCTCTSAQVCNSYASNLTCNPADNKCERLCASDQDCWMFQPPRVCDPVYSVCVSCSANTDCPSANQPHCDSVSFRCTGCVGPLDCSYRTDGLTQCSSNGSCVSP